MRIYVYQYLYQQGLVDSYLPQYVISIHIINFDVQIVPDLDSWEHLHAGSCDKFLFSECDCLLFRVTAGEQRGLPVGLT